ncbi:CDP-glycerol glycerophosphotransferase family protein [Candidatus Woesearchaeota archaeon]|nr:CDP-glycerol glycerophosphotransferase family protein [Candidatus Woesearchaeota archaeon]
MGKKGKNQNKINLLLIEFNNYQDARTLLNYSKRTRFNLLRFEDIYEVKYDTKIKFDRYWKHLKRLSIKNIPLYFKHLYNMLFREYKFNYDNIRKLNIQGLTFEKFKEIVKKNKIRAIIIPEGLIWLNNIINFSKRLDINVIGVCKEHLFSNVDGRVETYIKNIPPRSDLICIGGENGAKWWRMANGIKRNQVVVTGSPRFDAYFDKKLLKREEFCKKLNLDPNKKIIFFPSFDNTWSVREYKWDLNSLNNNYSKHDLDFCFPSVVSHTLDVSGLKSEILDVLYKVAQNNKDIQILIKLHPDQQPNLIDCVKYELLALKRNPSNFVGVKGVQKDIDPRDVITNVDMIVGHNSTMLMEGILLNKPLLVVKWGIASKKGWVPYYEFGACDAAKNKKEFYDKIISIVKNGEDISKYKEGRRRIIYNFLYKQDGKACERIFKAIEKLLREQK